jgi:sugar lactone lactonase YvrE
VAVIAAVPAVMPVLASATPVQIHASRTITGRLITAAHGTPSRLSTGSSPAATLAATFGPLPSSASGIAAAPLSSSLNEAGLSAAQELEAFPTQNVTPSDSSGAIGPNYYVEAVNDEIAVYSRSGLALVGSPVSLASFLGGTAPCNPQIRYDPVSERWFAVAYRCDGTVTENALYAAFSKTSDPSSLSAGWCKYSIPFGTHSERYPTLGLSSNHIIIGANEFTTGPNFDSARIFSAPKPTGPITACPETLPLTGFGSSSEQLRTSVENHLAQSPQAATETDSGPSGYVVAADRSGSAGGHIMIWQVAGGAETPTLAALGAPKVEAYEAPPRVPQPGVPPPEPEGSPDNMIDTLDGRLTQAVTATDPTTSEEEIWTQHTVAGGGTSVVRWYELRPSAVEVRQLGTVSEPAAYAFNGAISPTGGGGAVITYNTASATQKVELLAQSRPYYAPLGAMSSPVVLATSSSIDTDFSCTSAEGTGCLWGEYSSLSVDPTNGGLVWGSSQINGPPAEANRAQWATRNFALGVTLYPPIYSLSEGLESLSGAPTNVAANALREIWVSSAEADTVQKFNEGGGKVSALGPLEAPCSGQLDGPSGVAVDANGNLWVTDSLDGIVRKFSFAGKCLIQVGGEGTEAGQFKDPRGVAVDPHGNVWIADTGNNRIQELSPEGVFIRQIGPELDNGAGKLQAPSGVAADLHGHVWVADTGNARVAELGETGEYLSQIGATNTSGCDSVMCQPMQVAVALNGDVWVADYGSNRVDWFSEKGELISEVGTAGSQPGQLESPTGVTVDSGGNTWVADTGNKRLDKFIANVPATPTITKVQPNAGLEAGGTTVTITGTHFNDATAVRFGSTAATSFTVNSETSITAVSPAGTAGTVDVSVSTPGGTSAATAADHFTWELPAPAVTQISPASGGPPKGGTTVTITGLRFKAVSAVRFGSAIATSFTVNSETSITAVSPAVAPASAGSVDVTVTNSAGTSPTTPADQFRYVMAQQTAKLTGALEKGAGAFGRSVALSGDGKTAAAGGPRDNVEQGAAWVFVQEGSTWTEQGPKLGPGSNCKRGFQPLGENAALSGDGNTALFGIPRSVTTVVGGDACMFARAGSTWSEQAKLTAPTSEIVENFGQSVALSSDGNTALVGSDLDGAAWVFTRTGSTWTEIATLAPSEGAGTGTTQVLSVALSAEGNTAVIGGKSTVGEAAWVFTRAGSTWSEQASLKPRDATGEAQFGSSVALSADGNTALVGGNFDHNSQGAAWVFQRSGSAWAQQGAKLTASDEVGAGGFGAKVALSAAGDLALVSGPSDNGSVGAAWLFAQSGTAWKQQGAKATASGEVGGALFGSGVGLSSAGNVALIGGERDNAEVGAAWVFAVSIPTVAKVEPNTGPYSGGRTVTITGTNFKEVSAVKFGSTPAPHFTVNSETSITAVAPPVAPSTAGTVDITVATAEDTSPTSAADQFTYGQPVAAGDPAFYSNSVELSSGRLGVFSWGPIKFVSEALGAEWECVNLGFGDVSNEGMPPIGRGQILSWGGQGDFSLASGAPRRSCKFKKAGAEGEPEAWMTDEPVIETTRKAPLSVPWNLQLVCVEREGVQAPFVKIGIPDGLPLTSGCESEAEAAAAQSKEEEERQGCYATTVPEGCVKLDMVAPSLGLEALFEGTVLPRILDGFSTGLRPSMLQFTGGLGRLHLHNSFASTALASGESKLVGFGSEQLVIAR